MKKFFKCLGVGLFAIAIAIGGFFGAFKLNKKDNNNVSYAVNPIGQGYGDGSLGVLSEPSVRFHTYSAGLITDGYTNPDHFSYVLHTNLYIFQDNINGRKSFNRCVLSGYFFNDFNSLTSYNLTSYFFGSDLSGRFFLKLTPSNAEYFPVYYLRDSLFLYDSDLYSLDIYVINDNFFVSRLGYNQLFTTNYCEIVYSFKDTAGYSLSVSFPCVSDYLGWSNASNISINGSTYYYPTYYFDSNFNLTDNQIYQNGYNDGLDDNQSNIYDNGYNAGYNIGYGAGHSAGIIESNDYSFIALIGSVIDVPVKTFKGLLNFNVLGINLLNFALSLFTFAIILFLVRILKGGK